MKKLFGMLLFVGVLFQVQAQDFPLKSGSMHQPNPSRSTDQEWTFETKKIVDYQIVYSWNTGNNIADLNRQVVALIKQGWTPLGPATQYGNGGSIIQTMVKYQ